MRLMLEFAQSVLQDVLELPRNLLVQFVAGLVQPEGSELLVQPVVNVQAYVRQADTGA